MCTLVKGSVKWRTVIIHYVDISDPPLIVDTEPAKGGSDEALVVLGTELIIRINI
jgi:hypothetical protein